MLAAPRLGGLGHRLLLQCVHAAKATNGLLVEHHGFLAILRNAVLYDERFTQFVQQVVEMAKLRIIHFANTIYQGFHLGARCLSVIKQDKHQGYNDEKRAHKIGRGGSGMGTDL